MKETIDGSRCPRCALVVAPPEAYCPRHPVAMTPAALPGVGEIVSFTTLRVMALTRSLACPVRRQNRRARSRAPSVEK